MGATVGVWAVLADAPKSMVAVLAAEGITTKRIIFGAVADRDTFTNWAVTSRLVTAKDGAGQVFPLSRLCWQTGVCEANVGLVVAFRGDGRADPQRLAAAAAELPTFAAA